MNTSELLQTFKSARRVSTPLIAVTSPDPAATIRAIGAVTNGSPLVCWDIVRGLQGLNPAGRDVVTAVLNGDDPAMRANPVESLTLANSFPEKTVCFVLNSQRILGEYAVIQAVWNLRDTFKANGRTLVLLAPSLVLPAELANDVLLLDEPLPDAAAVTEIVAGIHRDAGLEPPELEIMNKAIDAVCGLPAFPTEQSTAMSLTRDGLDVSGLWERKRRMIEQTRGLSVWRGPETFQDVAGNQNVIEFLNSVFAGNERPRAIAFIDEIEKSAIGAGSGDTSGTSQDYLGCLLSYMQDTRATGIIAVGPPGSGKSLIAQTAGNTAGIPTVKMDIGAMKGSLVGESEANLRTALKVLTAVSQGQCLFIATCNAIASLPPELRRRFTFGTFFFDLPSASERASIWRLYFAKYKLQEQPKPMCDGWTGAEIRQCCDLAYRLRVTLLEASNYIVPVCKSAAESIERLRQQASGRFISASSQGTYRYEKTAAVSVSRAIEVE